VGKETRERGRGKQKGGLTGPQRSGSKQGGGGEKGAKGTSGKKKDGGEQYYLWSSQSEEKKLREGTNPKEESSE